MSESGDFMENILRRRNSRQSRQDIALALDDLGDNPAVVPLPPEPEPVPIPPTFLERCNAWQPNEESLWHRTLSYINGIREIIKPNQHIGIRIYWLLFSLFYYGLLVLSLESAFGQFGEHPLVMMLESVEIYVGSLPSPTIVIAIMNSLKNSALYDAFWLWRNSGFSKYQNDGNGLTDAFIDENNVSWTYNETVGMLYCLNDVCTSTTSLSSIYELDFGEESSDVLNLFNAYTKNNNITVYDDPDNPLFENKIMPAIANGLINCSALIVACAWSGSKEKCNEQFKLSYSDYGGICSINKMAGQAMRRYKSVASYIEEPVSAEVLARWKSFDKDKHIRTSKGEKFSFNATKNETIFDEIPMRLKGAGQPFGLSMAIAYDPRTFGCKQQDGAGIKVGVHGVWEESNLRSFGTALLPNHENFLAVYPDVTFMDESIRQIDKDVRGCYTTEDYPLKYFRKYTQSNCLLECLSDAIQHECNCTLLSSPKNPKDSARVLCNPDQKKCAREVEAKIYSEGPDEMCAQCLPSCTEIVYRVVNSAVPYDVDYPPAVLVKRFGDKWKNMTTAVIHIFYGTPTVVGRKRKVAHDKFEKIGLVGGIFGFTVGHALLDIAYLAIPFLEMIFRPPRVVGVAPMAAVAPIVAAANNILEPSRFIEVQPADQVPVENHM